MTRHPSNGRSNGQKSDLVDIVVELEHETDKAWLVRWDEDIDPVWIPMSQGELEPIKGKSAYTLTIPKWLADKNEMEG